MPLTDCQQSGDMAAGLAVGGRVFGGVRWRFTCPITLGKRPDRSDAHTLQVKRAGRKGWSSTPRILILPTVEGGANGPQQVAMAR